MAAKIKDKIITIALIAILTLLLKRGLDQTNGKINGPTNKKPIISEDFLKYHLS